HTAGAVLSTGIALLFANICNFYILKKYAKFTFTETWIQFAKIFIYGFIMMLCVEAAYWVMQLIVSPQTKIGSLIILIVGVVIGMVVY
ncbi:polysaccharide biosynthesis C-terminal domain-containing protein, partial [Klebsiella pneumoniae]|nr:polysaccharide biosynthesis C-terminal domain-containing protein [Klebsiella pneumoniae]